MRNGVKCIIHITDAGAYGTKYSFGERQQNKDLNYIHWFLNVQKKINFQIINRDVNSFNFFKNIFERNGGKNILLKHLIQ